MGEYRTSAHAVFDIKYHIVWITKYRYKILRGRVAERARDLLRQICQSREVVIVRGVTGSHSHAGVLSAEHGAGETGAVLEGPVVTPIAGRTGGNTSGRGGTSARAWARWTRIPSRSISRARNGTTKIKGSRSPRPPSLEPALSREPFRRL
jgi:Transposase IS200 like